MEPNTNPTKSAFSRAMGTPSAPTEVKQEGRGEPRVPYISKFTMQFGNDDAVTLDEVTLKCRRLLGRPVKKSEVLRSLIAIAADDPTLRNQLVEELRNRQTNG